MRVSADAARDFRGIGSPAASSRAQAASARAAPRGGHWLLADQHEDQALDRRDHRQDVHEQVAGIGVEDQALPEGAVHQRPGADGESGDEPPRPAGRACGSLSAWGPGSSFRRVRPLGFSVIIVRNPALAEGRFSLGFLDRLWKEYAAPSSGPSSRESVQCSASAPTASN